MRRREPQVEPEELARLHQIGELLGRAYLRLLVRGARPDTNQRNRLDEIAPISPSCAGVKHQLRNEGAA